MLIRDKSLCYDVVAMPNVLKVIIPDFIFPRACLVSFQHGVFELVIMQGQEYLLATFDRFFEIWNEGEKWESILIKYVEILTIDIKNVCVSLQNIYDYLWVTQ